MTDSQAVEAATEKRLTLCEWQREKESSLRRSVRLTLTKFASAGDAASIKRIISQELVADAADGYAKAVRGEWPFMKPQPWALRDVLEIAGAIGTQPQVQIAILQQIGVSVEAARRAVGMVQEVEAMPPEEQAREAAEFLRRWNAEHPGAEVTL